MQKSLILKVFLISLLFFSCNQTKNQNKNIEIDIEIEKINDSLSKATIIKITKQNTNENKDVKIIEGTPGYVKSEVEKYKNLNLTNTSFKEKNKINKTIEIELTSKSGSSTKGYIFFDENNGIVKLKAKLTGLNPGTHAIHIHQKADCSSDDGKSSGGHWNPTYQKHGKWGDENGFHRGDIGNFTSDSKGNASIEFETNLWCLSCDDINKNIIGKAIIVHEGEDDLVSQPSGAAGARISCGGIIN